MPRLFFALDITPQDKAKIAQWRAQYLSLPFKAINSDNFHITLAFLGNINIQQQQALTLFADQIATHLSIKEKSLLLDHCGLFKKPQVLYLGISQPPLWLISLANSLSQQAVKLAIFQEKRNYCPHLSLYRKAKNLPYHSINSFSITLNTFSLYLSSSTPDGVRYKALKTWSLY